jgi:hypothetical protein
LTERDFIDGVPFILLMQLSKAESAQKSFFFFFFPSPGLSSSAAWLLGVKINERCQELFKTPDE